MKDGIAMTYGSNKGWAYLPNQIQLEAISNTKLTGSEKKTFEFTKNYLVRNWPKERKTKTPKYII